MIEFMESANSSNSAIIIAGAVNLSSFSAAQQSSWLFSYRK